MWTKIFVRKATSLLVALSIVVALKCSNDSGTEATPPTPPNDLDYVGTWRGNIDFCTSPLSGCPVNIIIDDKGGKAVITLITFIANHIGYGDGSFRHFDFSEGLTEVKNGVFNYIGGSGEIDGVFSNTSSLSGKWNFTFRDPSIGGSSFYKSGDYMATKIVLFP